MFDIIFFKIKNDKIPVQLKNFFNRKTHWCASSTHRGEEEFCIDAHCNLKKKYKNLVSIIIPRHVDRRNEIIDIAKSKNLKFFCHSSGEMIPSDTEIYIVDTYGETETFYNLSNIVFMGGSIIKHGGQNPLEAARYGCKIIHGPNIENFRDIYKLLDKNNIENFVEPSNVDEDLVKMSLLNENASPETISKNLAELKANKVSMKKPNKLVLGADSVIDLEGELISKPGSRDEAIKILKKLNGKVHYLISSVCISKDGVMVWNYTDRAKLTMKVFTENELERYLSKISDEALYSYNVYQIEGEGRALFSKIEGDENTIMGLPIDKIKDYLKNYE